MNNMIETGEQPLLSLESLAGMETGDLHQKGINLVSAQLAATGFEILHQEYDPTLSPQMIVRRNKTLSHVIVWTEEFPDQPEIPERMGRSLAAAANAAGCECLFVGVVAEKPEGGGAVSSSSAADRLYISEQTRLSIYEAPSEKIRPIPLGTPENSQSDVSAATPSSSSSAASSANVTKPAAAVTIPAPAAPAAPPPEDNHVPVARKSLVPEIEEDGDDMFTLPAKTKLNSSGDISDTTSEIDSLFSAYDQDEETETGIADDEEEHEAVTMSEKDIGKADKISATQPAKKWWQIWKK